jgi:chromosomal replication initiator protein
MPSVSASLWDQCRDSLASALPVQPYNTWIRPVELLDYDAAGDKPILTLGVPDDFHGSWIERHYGDLLSGAIERFSGHRPILRFQVSRHAVAEPVAAYGDGNFASVDEVAAEIIAHRGEPVMAPECPAPLRRPGTLNPAYTFDDFIEADCNRLARSAALAVAQRPAATSFNPYLVYGKVGLGKTHLAHAIGNQIADEHPELRVLYLTSEAFTNCFVHAVQHNLLGDFSRSFREIDVLIVDDVQFLSGKEKTQEQFFHLFNDLHQGGAQIVLCADRPPSEIAGIEDRLLSRFRWGLSVDVQPPDFETRVAILQRRAGRAGLDLPYEVVEYLAGHVTDNIRSLEGALNRILAAHRIGILELTLSGIKPLLADLIRTDQRRTLSASAIRDLVAEAYGLTPDDLVGKSRKRRIVDARHVAMHFCKQTTSLSLEAIGNRFGGRDHSTVIHACRAVQARLDTDPGFVEEMERLALRLDAAQ